MPAAALKYAASFCFFFVNEILIKLQAKKEFAQQVWQAHIYRTLLCCGSFYPKQHRKN